MSRQEDLDNIILPILKEIECSFSTSVKSLKDFGSNELVMSVSKCLRKIDNKIRLPTQLPKSQAARFRICTDLAFAIEQNGYDGEIGYQTFLYPNHDDIQKILTFLIHKLPKIEEDDTFGDNSKFKHQVLRTFQLWPTRWVPPIKPFSRKYQPLLAKQSSPNKFFPSIINFINLFRLNKEKNKKEFEKYGLNAPQYHKEKQEKVKRMIQEAFGNYSKKMSHLSLSSHFPHHDTNTTFTRRMEFATEQSHHKAFVINDHGSITTLNQDDTLNQEEKEKQREAELNEEQQKLHEINTKIKEINQKCLLIPQLIRQHESDIHSQNEELEKLKEKYVLSKRTLELLPEADKNIESLNNIIQNSINTLHSLAVEWEKHRISLIESARDKNKEGGKIKNEMKEQLNKIVKCREEMKNMTEEIQKKEEQYNQLLEEYNKLPTDINRHSYINRILNIVEQNEKQKKAISKSIDDVRSIQREYNTTLGIFSRSFALTDHLLFAAAQNNQTITGDSDPYAVTAYQCLVELRDGFDNLLSMVDKIGQVKKDIITMESNLKALSAKQYDTTRINQDLNIVTEENQILMKKIAEISNNA